MYTFWELLKEIDNGKTFEELSEGSNVECFKNEVYEDEDLFSFLRQCNAEIVDYIPIVGNIGVAKIVQTKETELNKNFPFTVYVPYKSIPNRFGEDENETLFSFNKWLI